MLQDLNLEVFSCLDFPDLPEVVEEGSNFQENAVKKASLVAQASGITALADDSGLEIDALGGQPGVLSARFAGDPPDYRANNWKVLEMMQNVPLPKRTARFRCVVALATPEGEVRVVEGTVSGQITFEPRGEAGFGYDPIFLIPEYGKTFAELGLEIKNRISHRARALHRTKKVIQELMVQGKL